ncbi:MULTISPECIES: hypothetical protein [Bacillus cereus group]|uniref:hypothetical protein n=1 Tax=Bacillus cereus group TaxID=86661 RepID=UPI0005CE0BAE|nr:MULTISPECIES: hypothetical protein [Bacillus cereus group]
MSSGLSRATILEAKDYEAAQVQIKDSFYNQRNYNNVLYIDADNPDGNVFEVAEKNVVCIDYEKAE